MHVEVCGAVFTYQVVLLQVNESVIDFFAFNSIPHMNDFQPRIFTDSRIFCWVMHEMLHEMPGLGPRQLRNSDERPDQELTVRTFYALFVNDTHARNAK